ncbi:MAG: glycosyltransferase family 2 protein, partial [archaeon]|nr:glycosyltransferase family 2 protein [archaeon]
TEDIEITWRLLDKGYDVKMSLVSRAYTIAPAKFKPWLKQRIRWNMGGVQAMVKHKEKFFKKGMLGFFVLPLFISSWIIGIVGLLFFIYRFGKWVFVRYLTTTYSIGANAAIISAGDLSLNPDILFFFGIILFVAGLIFTLISIFHEKEKGFKSPRILEIGVYTFFYLLTYPVILVMSVYKLLRRNMKWQ